MAPPNSKTWNTAVKPAPNRWLCANSTVMPSHTHKHKRSQKNSSSRKLQYPQYCLGRLRCPFFLFYLCNLLTRLSIWEEDTEKKGTLAEMLDSHWGPKRCQLDISADPRGVEEKLEDITVHLRGDTVQWIVTIKKNSCFAFLNEDWQSWQDSMRSHRAWLANQITPTILLKHKSLRISFSWHGWNLQP